MARARSERLFTFRSGGWVLGLGIFMGIAGTLWNLAPLWRSGRPAPRGDGQTVASYGFDLSNALVPVARIAASGLVADGLPALVDPKTISPAAVAQLPPIGRGTYLVSTDKVIGVVLGGEARAYPLRMMVWHEIANDTVGGVPVAVTYNPLSGGIAVFDRRVAGRTASFGVSGLLYQSNLLLYDRRPKHRGESLWSQLQARAISGPAAGTRLEILPFALCRYGDWIRDHPETTVLAPIASEAERYAEDVYGPYVNTETLRFPVVPLPPAGTLPLKAPVFVPARPGPRTVVPLALDPTAQRFEPVGVSGTTPEAGIAADWFAWYATHPDDPGRIVR